MQIRQYKQKNGFLLTNPNYTLILTDIVYVIIL